MQIVRVDKMEKVKKVELTEKEIQLLTGLLYDAESEFSGFVESQLIYEMVWLRDKLEWYIR